MSQQGINRFAKVMSDIQTAREELIRMGTQPNVIKTRLGNQDVHLGQLLNQATDAVKDEFMKIVAMKI